MPDVLVIDDDRDMREAMQRVLVLKGLEVAIAADGAEALAALATMDHLPHVLLTDLEMPVMSGWELLEELRADARLSAIPVVIVSGRIDERVTGKAMVSLRKPFAPHQLVSLVQAFIPEK